MKKRKSDLAFIVVAVVAVFALAFLAGNYFGNSTTGQATLTPGANYGPIKSTTNKVKCEYLTENDGWDVTYRGEIDFYDKVTGVKRRFEDHCETPRALVEYHCEGEYKQERMVNCPTGTRCNQGTCK